MNEHFKEQLAHTEPLTEESIKELKQARIDQGHSTKSLEELVPGDKMLFVMVEYSKGDDEDGRPKLQINIERILERDIESFEDTHEFIEMSGANATLPRYKELSNNET